MPKNLFNTVQVPTPSSNVFDLTHDVKLSTIMGRLTPILAMDCVPGDKVTIGCENIVRFAPMLAPLMHRIDVSMHYFFVPNRILWDHWETFITGDSLSPSNPSAAPAHPYVELEKQTAVPGTLPNYLGVPFVGGSTDPLDVSAFPFAAYQCIYNEYYRDQNLIDPINYKLEDGNQTAPTAAADLLTIRTRAWQHDYFTAALPFAQKGPSVDIPLGTVEYEHDPLSWGSGPGENPNPPRWMNNANQVTPTSGTTNLYASGPGGGLNGDTETSGSLVGYDPQGTLVVEPTTINDLRRAFKLQEWLERNARGGTRYIENILAHFGVRSSDARLNRPEYITGTKTPVVISEVLNTTGDPTGEPQGNMAGHGISVTTGNYGRYYCEEHGYIIGIMSVMPKTAYQQGVPKHFIKFDRLDYFWPSFAHLGEQEVKNIEVYLNHAQPQETFGYVPRYSEYKYMASRVAGEFQTTLDYWHLGRQFASQPALNQAFIECNPRNDIFAVTTGDNLFCHVLNKIKAVRKMPKFGTPSF